MVVNTGSKSGSVQFSHLVVSDSLRFHESQYARPPSQSPTPGVYSNPCPLSRWCHPTISCSVVPSPPAFNLTQHQGLFQWVGSLHQVAEYWSLTSSISSSSEYSGLISFRSDWFDLLAIQESSPAPQFKSINSSALSLLHSPTLTSIHAYWKNHSFD